MFSLKFGRFNLTIGNAQKEQASISVGSSAGWADLNNGAQFKALENSAFWTCLTKLCRTFASLPMGVYQGYEEQPASALQYLLDHPCPYMDNYQWRWVMSFNYEMFGIAFAIIERSRSGAPAILWPVSPNTMAWVQENGVTGYRYAFGDGGVIPLSDLVVFHNTPVGYHTVLNPSEYATKDINLASSSRELQTKFFDQGTTLGGVLTVPKGTDKKTKDELKAMIQANFSGTRNAYRTMIIEDQMKYEPIRLSQKDTADIQTALGWTTDEVARRFGVPPFFAGDLSKATWGNAEQQGMDLVEYAIQPRAVSWEDALSKLCAPKQYIKINLRGLMRADHAARAQYYATLVGNGLMKPNEARRLEDLPPVPGGDQLFFPLNYTTLDKVGQTAVYTGTEEQARFLLQFAKLVAEVMPQASHADTHMDERAQRDGLIVEAVNVVSRTNRAKVEKVIRMQLRKEITQMLGLSGEPDEIVRAFGDYCKSIAADYSKACYPVYQSMGAKLLPAIRKATGITTELDQQALDNFAAKYADGMAARHSQMRQKELASALKGVGKDSVAQAMKDLGDHWLDVVPAEESSEEVQRAANATNHFIYQQLGVKYMHVVASADTCEFCRSLDGKVVEVSGHVLTKGQNVTDGEGNVRTIERSMAHPPWHTHCTCTIAPGR